MLVDNDGATATSCIIMLPFHYKKVKDARVQFLIGSSVSRVT